LEGEGKTAGNGSFDSSRLGGASPVTVPAASIKEIDTMDIDDLVHRTLDRQAVSSEGDSE
jgi:hypothetical protein